MIDQDFKVQIIAEATGITDPEEIAELKEIKDAIIEEIEEYNEEKEEDIK